MAVNLNPGADQTLVAAATKAAMANVPKDLSGTFESMASEYGKTMRVVGESFASAAKTLGEVGGQLVKKAVKEIRTEDENMSVLIEKEIEIEQPKEINAAEGASYTYDDGSKPPESPYGSTGKLTEVTDFEKPESERKKEALDKTPGTTTEKPKTKTQATSLGQELRDIRKELSSLFLKTDPKSRKRKAELRAKKDSYYTEIALLKQENDANNQLLANENVNLEATGSLNLALNLAIKDYKTKGGKIKEGPYKGYSAALSRNEDGDLSWTLKDPSGKHVTGRDPQGNLITTGNKPYKVPLSEMSKTLTPKMDQKVVDDANKIINSAFTSGKQGIDYMGNQLVSKFRPLLDNETSLQQLADVRLGDDTKTLREHVNSESEHSAEIFAELSSVELASMGVDEMADGKAGYTEADFVGSAVAVENFEKVRSATFDKDNDNYDNGSHLKRLTEKHIYRTGELMHGVGADASGTDYAAKLRKAKYDQYVKSLSNPSEITIKDYEDIKFGNQNMKGPTARKVLEDIPTGTVTDPRDGSTYNWNNDGWYDDKNKSVAKDNDTFVKNVLQLMDPRFYGIAGISSAGGDGIEVVDEYNTQFGRGLGKQTVKSSSLLSSLQSFPNVELNTTGDLQTLLGKVESDKDLKQKLIDHLNKKMNSSIDIDMVDDMIKHLIGNTKKKLK